MKPRLLSEATTGMQQSPQQHETGRSKPADTLLIGPCNEGAVGVNGEMCKALIDSGSQVTTITDEFWRQHPLLCTQELQPSDIPIEGAAGQSVSYGAFPLHGTVRFGSVRFDSVRNCSARFAFPLREYRSSVPLLSETNVIRVSRNDLQASYGRRSLAKVKLTNPERHSAVVAVSKSEPGGVTDKFYDHLYGHKFSLLTDNNPHKYVMSTGKLDATGQRWVSQLAMFDFDIEYRQVKSNSNADALSRMSSQEVTKTLQSCPQFISSTQQDKSCGDESGRKEVDVSEQTERTVVGKEGEFLDRVDELANPFDGVAKEQCEYSEYVQTLHVCLTYAYDEADRMLRHAKDLQKKHYDKKAKIHMFQPGDRVMVKVCYVEGKQKLADRWEPRPYVVVKKQPGIPLYVVRPEDGDRKRVIH
ncbi:hypothetical protein PO909_033290 [Leuciscus waleckii]